MKARLREKTLVFISLFVVVFMVITKLGEFLLFNRTLLL
ncbi:hypothetical protein SIN_1515 [Streptococcus infantis SK1302]|uniref:Uncharacterized protein n=1 Tax=Streptococcus infantis SK1302 TaxID=871237 RepID=A0ABN0B3E6_9STRE|nr:hypothetical protein SIN_1515 [Streptococcus infantis SK1302]